MESPPRALTTTPAEQPSPMASTVPIVVPQLPELTDCATSSPSLITTGLAPPSVSPVATAHTTPNGSGSTTNAMMALGPIKAKTVPKSQSGMNGGRWTEQEHQSFLAGLRLYGREWKKVASKIKTRTSAQIRSHAQKYFAKLARDDETRRLGNNGLPVLAMGPDGASSLYGGYLSDDGSSTTAGNLSGDEDTDGGSTQPTTIATAPPPTMATPSHRTILPVHPFPSPVLAPPTPGLSISSFFNPQRGPQVSTTKKRARPSGPPNELSPPPMAAMAAHSHPFKQLKPATSDAMLFHRLPSPEELIETVSPPVRQRLSSLIEAEISALQVLSCYTWLQQQQGELKVQLQAPSRHGSAATSSGSAVFPSPSLTMFAAERSPSIF